MSIDITAQDFLMGGGITSAKFPDGAYGTTVGGPITQPPRVEQQKDLDTGELKFWNDGKPMMQMIVTVQTDLRDPAVADDDGQRAFYIKANSLKAVRDAVRRSGAKSLEVGGMLALTYTGDGEKKKAGKNPPKLYSATYSPPSAAQANEFLNGGAPQAPAAHPGGFTPANQGPAPQWAQPAQAPAPAAPQPAAPAASGVWTPPTGMDPAQAAALAALTPEQRAALGYA
ncbi:hypothetical protein ACIBKY_53405 [Nonomuraea sp. NPDC050394]|uniref:hypothetical protein n=1 Tax=Nonomuraea sp. NPDC050394 TaxID=3364363 RepID=UPI0037A4C33D